MSPSPDPRPRRPVRPRRPRRPARPRDAGFSLLEIVVALGVLAIVLVALLPQLVGGIRATATARVVTQSKGISQGQLERMRHLPFHIAPSAGDFVDVLDYYYPDLGAPGTTPVCKTGAAYRLPAAGWEGYVAPVAGRCDYEPAGAFYRTVDVIAAATGITGFTVVTDTQFLSGATPPTPVTPFAGYDTGVVGEDNPAASQLGVTVTVLYDERGTIRPVTSYTQVAERHVATVLVRSEADVRVLDLGSVADAGVPLSLSAGLLNLTGSASYISTVDATLTAVSAGLATGEQQEGARTTVTSPPATSLAAVSAPPRALSPYGCAYACWGSTSLGGFALSSQNGLPVAGSAAQPAQALVTDQTNSGLSFGDSGTSAYRPGLDLVPPLVRLDPSAPVGWSGLSGCGVASTGASSYLSASGYLQTTAAGPSGAVVSCAVARAAPVELFPTTFAPHGVVRVELKHASASCQVSGSGHASTTAYDYRAVVQYFDGSSYVTVPEVTPSVTVDPLGSVPLTTPVGGGHSLGDYIASWSTLTPAKVNAVQATGIAQVKLPGIVTIASEPVRGVDSLPDDTSVVSLTVGALSCQAEDAR